MQYAIKIFLRKVKVFAKLYFFVLCWIFDVDDTLVEYVDFDMREWYEFIAEPVARKYGIPFDFNTWKRIISGEISRRHSERYGVPAEIFWREVDKKNLGYRKWMYNQGRLKLYPDVPFIENLQGKKIAWSVSSEDCVKYVLSLFGIKEIFDFVIGKDYENYRYLEKVKPSSKFIEIIKDRCSCDRCIVIGDSDKDMLAARYAGCLAVHISRDGRISRYADIVITSLHQLADKKFL